MEFIPGPLLAKIDSPDDLKNLSEDQLIQVCDELRQYIIDVVSVKGGHFGASLGVVELTVAMHYVFNTPIDQLIWDVGHQAYGHKILTGRRDIFPTNRIYKGISGFPKRSESVYDTFGVGHSSTSISAGVGMSIANRIQNDDRQIVAVIGDGAMTAGMAYEAMNHAGWDKTNMIVVLNDNCMSIDPNVGALKEYLTDIATSKTYNKVKDEVWNLLGKVSKFGPNAQKIVQNIEHAFKNALLQESNMFESLGFRYFGPVDGHDVNHLVNVLRDLKDIPGPKILHTLTMKGKGYGPAEEGSPTKWHAPGLFDKVTGEIIKSESKGPKAPKYQDVFGHTIIEIAQENEKVVGVTPAMPTGCSLKFMMEQMPDRAFDVGIAEQHAVTFSAGMATQGLIPFCNIYSSFMQRAYDQVVHDVALQNLHVVFCLDRAGMAGSDGPTHHGAFDIAYMRCIPNMVVCAPMNEQELRNMMYTGVYGQSGPFTIRYPRGEGVMPNWRTPLELIPVGKGRMITEGDEVAILSIGHIGNYAVDAWKELQREGIYAAHYDMRFAKPLDEAMLHDIFKRFDRIVTVEDGCILGGFGSAVVEFMAQNGYSAKVKMLGIPDKFIEHGSQDELFTECHYDKEAIKQAVAEFTNENKLVLDFA